MSSKTGSFRRDGRRIRRAARKGLPNADLRILSHSRRGEALSPSHIQSVHLLNISASGLGLETSSFLQKGDILGLEVNLKEDFGKIEFKGVVRTVAPKENLYPRASQKGPRKLIYIIGIELLDLPEEVLRKLNNYLASTSIVI